VPMAAGNSSGSEGRPSFPEKKNLVKGPTSSQNIFVPETLTGLSELTQISPVNQKQGFIDCGNLKTNSIGMRTQRGLL